MRTMMTRTGRQAIGNYCALTLLLLLAGLPPGAIASRVELGETVLRVPTEHSSGHIMINVRVNGRGPFPFLLDTGASGDGRIDTSLVNLLGLEKVGERLNDDGSGLNIHNTDVVRIDSIQFAGATFRDLHFMAGNYRSRSYPARKPVMGVLALEMFSELLLTIDYSGEAINLEFGQLAAEDSVHVTTYTRGRENLSCLIEVRLGARKFLAGIDTGHQGSLILPYEHLEGLRIYGRPIKVGYAKTVNNEFDLYGAVLVDPLEFAGQAVLNVSASFARGWGYPTIGYQILKKFVLTFDQKNRLVRFVPR